MTKRTALDPAAAVNQVAKLLAAGKLSDDDLSTRKLATRLGKSTVFFYHHFGSIDAFLLGACAEALGILAKRWHAMLKRGDLAELGNAWIELGLRNPTFYDLAMQRPMDWEALRAKGWQPQPLPIWSVAVQMFQERGSSDPDADARLYLATLHGITLMVRSGRANVGARHKSDRRLGREILEHALEKFTP